MNMNAARNRIILTCLMCLPLLMAGLVTIKICKVYLDQLSVVHAAALAPLPPLAPAGNVPFRRIVLDPNVGANPWMKIVADIDGDGFNDAIVGSNDNQALVWYQYPVAGPTNPWRKTFIRTSGAWSVSSVDAAAADIDGDGDPDIVVAGPRWWENPRPSKDPAVGAAWIPHDIDSLDAHDIRVADIDQNGRLDIVSRVFGDIFIYKQTGPNTWSKSVLAVGAGQGFELGDLNNDGFPDIATGDSWYENIAGTTWVRHVFANPGSRYSAVAIGDINGDGRPDVVLGPPEAAGNLMWLEAPADPRSPSWVQHIVDSVGNTHEIHVADMDADGHNDIVTAEYPCDFGDCGRNRVLIYYNLQGTAQVLTRQIVDTTGAHNIQVADFGNDGDLDLLAANAFPLGGINPPVQFWENLLHSPGYPTISSISPTITTAGGPALTLTVRGTNFAADHIVRWNGRNRVTSFSSGTVLTATIRASDIKDDGTGDVTVFNPTSGLLSNSQTLTIIESESIRAYAPTITSISPSLAAVGGPALTLTVNGTNFVSNSIVRWNGADRVTAFGSSTSLSASILASDIAVAGTADVTVFNPTQAAVGNQQGHSDKEQDAEDDDGEHGSDHGGGQSGGRGSGLLSNGQTFTITTGGQPFYRVSRKD